MQRYVNCPFRVNKEVVKREIVYKYGSLKNYCKHAGYSRARFYQIISTPHLSKEVKCLKDLAKDLNMSVDDIVL